MSHPRVFITLGRTGQVVERGGTGSNSGELRCDTGPRSGSKRSIGDALRIYPRSSLVSSKRLRYGTYQGAHENRVNEMGLTAKDLRLKLMRQRSKRIQCGLEEHRKVDHLHQKRAKSSLPSASNSWFQLRPEAKESFHLRQISYTQNADHMHQVDSMRKLNSSRIVDEVGARPSDIIIKSSRAIAPLTNYDGRQQFSSIRATDVLTAKRNGVFYASRPIGFTPPTFKGTVENGKPVTQLAPMDGIVDSQVVLFCYSFFLSFFPCLRMSLSYIMLLQGEVPHTVSGLLHSLELEKYEIAFCAEEVDMTALKQMGDKDLKDLGIPMGPRKKILQALLPRSKRQLPQICNLK